jgi:nitrate/TMAO reductase-like tetraheme cytochrome c subunit
MPKILKLIKLFFFPPAGTPRWLRVLPYALLGILTIVVFISSAYAWEYTNSPEFCGSACHTMPPEYTSYLTSPHARIDCVDCHIGKGFITTRITRKAGDAKHIIRLAFKDYEFPITAGELRPARDTCEKCHFPEKFSDDSLREIKHYGNDSANTPSSVYLILKTGGGTKRLGLGQGIHWHIENKVMFYSEDSKQQEIPYIRVIREDGSIDEYTDIESSFSNTDIDESQLHTMDCITCHNRITHLVNPPEDMIDKLLDRGVVSPSIPDIRRQAIDLFYREYESTAVALNSFEGLRDYYQHYFSDFYLENRGLVDQAITELREAYSQSVYIEQKSDWDSHPNNVGHEFSPGCFRCHDGNHLNEKDEAIRLECNICHSIPVVVGSTDFVSNLEISHGLEPETHLNSNWIGLHRDVFDATCQNCHTVDDPGGVSNNSFCSNSACHGSIFKYAGLDAPSLRKILLEQLPEQELEPTPIELVQDNYSFVAIGPIFRTRCGSCHGVGGIQGLNLTTYKGTLTGGISGPSILPGDPENSLLLQKQTGDQPHFSSFSQEEINLVIEWIINGAPED